MSMFRLLEHHNHLRSGKDTKFNYSYLVSELKYINKPMNLINTQKQAPFVHLQEHVSVEYCNNNLTLLSISLEL
jgi:hypothetical protein